MAERNRPVDAPVFLTGLLAEALKNMRNTDSPTTTFVAGNCEFQLTLKRIDGRRVMTKAERQLARRVKEGQNQLTPAEVRLAKRILKGA